MTDTELIARQAKELVEARDEIAELRQCIEAAQLRIICIGGPLNDNKLKYTSEQLKEWQGVYRCLET